DHRLSLREKSAAGKLASTLKAQKLRPKLGPAFNSAPESRGQAVGYSLLGPYPVAASRACENGSKNDRKVACESSRGEIFRILLGQSNGVRHIDVVDLRKTGNAWPQSQDTTL